MAFDADIIVTDGEGSDIALVVEAKTAVRDLESAEHQLKRYMTGMQCPVGILVSPERLWLYRNRYLDSPADSVARVGEFDVSNVFHFTPSGSGRNSAFAFEAEVQSWLEGLRTEAGLRDLPADLRRAVRLYIDPAISNGTIRAGHPRESLSA
jgi:hypothetical protein